MLKTKEADFPDRLVNFYRNRWYHIQQIVLCSSLVGPGDRDGIVGIVTWYRLNGQDIDSRCRRDFSHPSRPCSLLHNGYRVIPRE